MVGDWGTDDRTPPHSLAAERAVLGSVLIKPQSMGRLAKTLEPDDFFLPAHRHVFEAMLDIQAANRQCDPIVVDDRIGARGNRAAVGGGAGGVLAFLMELAHSTPTGENIAMYARIVREKASLRRIIGACAEAMTMAYGEAPSSELVAGLATKVWHRQPGVRPARFERMAPAAAVGSSPEVRSGGTGNPTPRGSR